MGFPLAMSAPGMLQPGGSAAMQGSMAADGTAWALRTIAGPVPQLGAVMPGGLEPGRKSPNNEPGATAKRRDGDRRGRQGDPAGAPALHGDRLPGRGEGAELAEQVAGVASHEGAQLGGAGDPAGGGERFGEFVGGEVGQRPR